MAVAGTTIGVGRALFLITCTRRKNTLITTLVAALAGTGIIATRLAAVIHAGLRAIAESAVVTFRVARAAFVAASTEPAVIRAARIAALGQVTVTAVSATWFPGGLCPTVVRAVATILTGLA